MVTATQYESLARLVDFLAPSDELAPVNDPTDLRDAASGLNAGATGWAVAVSRQCADAVIVSMGEHVGRLPEAETRRAIEASVLSLLRYIAGHTDRFELNARQISLARKMARLGFPYERYMGGLRTEQAIVLDALLDRAAEYRPAQDRPWLLRAITTLVTRFFDESVGAVISEYLAERQRAITQALTDQRRITTALISGEYVPEEVAARTLRIDLGQHHLALILWARDKEGAPAAQGELERAAARAADTLRAPAPLTIPEDSDENVLLCWITSPGPFPVSHLDALTGLLGGAGGFCAAVGIPGQGATGFRRTYLTARDAERVARQGLPRKITAYHDVGVISLLTSDLERARWFVTDELGQLASPDDTLADLRATALCYLECGGNLVRTAAALHVHRNTVVYRLGNIERLLGRTMSERPLETHAALTLARQLGDSLYDQDLAAQAHARRIMEDITYL